MFQFDLLSVPLLASYHVGHPQAEVQGAQLDQKHQQRSQHRLCRGTSDQVSNPTPKENSRIVTTVFHRLNL